MKPSEFLQSFLQTWNETLRVSSKFLTNLEWCLQSFFKVCSKLGMKPSEFLQSLFQAWNEAFKVWNKLGMEHSKFVTNFECSILWMLHSKFVTNLEWNIQRMEQNLNAPFQVWNKLWRNSECSIPSLEQTLKKLWRLHPKFGTNFEETLKATFQLFRFFQKIRNKFRFSEKLFPNITNHCHNTWKIKHKPCNRFSSLQFSNPKIHQQIHEMNKGFNNDMDMDMDTEMDRTITCT